jgi:hypothetical protein
MADFEVSIDVECVFPMSGQYGRAPRVLYYALILFVIVFRRQDWLTAGAAAFCLTYGGSAAIHALLLAPSLALARPSVPNGIVTTTDGTEITVKALAIDLDADATLAIVGAGFLAVIPMALWSAQFRHSGAVPILVLWIILMFAGMICSMAVSYGVDRSFVGPLLQYRFCTPGYNNTLPFSGNPTIPINNNWNETIWTYFTNSTIKNPSCIYPCLSSTYFLRQAGDLHVGILPGPFFSGFYNIYTAEIMWVCVPVNIILSIIILVLRLRGHNSTSLHISFRSPFHSFKDKALDVLATLLNHSYARKLMMYTFCLFLWFTELIIWIDLQSEEMQLVGQWAPLVGVGLVLVAAFVGKYWPRGKRFLLRFRERKEIVKRSGIKEGVRESLSRVWKERHERSTWSHMGIVFSQGDDLD